MTFGRFVGSWGMDVRFYDPDGEISIEGPATWTFAWVLEGRAIQDVLVFGSPEDGTATSRGSTMRYFDPRAGLWQVYWLGSLSGVIVRLHGKPSDGEILLEGEDADGSRVRWTFEDVTADSFHWRGVTSDDGGRSWHLEQEMLARRLTDGAPA